MDIGFKIESMKEVENEAFLDDHPRGFRRMGNRMDYYNTSNNVLHSGATLHSSPSSHLLFKNSISRLSDVQRSPQANHRTEMPTSRESISIQKSLDGSLDAIDFKSGEFKATE